MSDAASYLTNDPEPVTRPPAARYCHSTDAEVYRGDYPTREAAIEAARLAHNHPPMAIFTGRCVDVNWDAVANGSEAEWIVENMIDRLFDQVGESADTFDPTPTETAVLQKRLNAVAREWIGQVQPAVYRVVDVQKHAGA